MGTIGDAIKARMQVLADALDTSPRDPLTDRVRAPVRDEEVEGIIARYGFGSEPPQTTYPSGYPVSFPGVYPGFGDKLPGAAYRANTFLDFLFRAMNDILGDQAAGDTKTPAGTWASSTTVAFAARVGQPPTVKLTLQDGSQRTMTAGTWDKTNGVADWGYDDVGSQGNNKWLYFYAVPKSGDADFLVVRASDNPPSSGPAGYSSWRLVWSTYIDGSGNLLKVLQRGNEFRWAAFFNIDSNSNPSHETSLQPVSLAVNVPAHATELICASHAYNNTGFAIIEFSSDGTNVLDQMWVSDNGVGLGSDENYGEHKIPIVTSQIVYRRFDEAVGGGNIQYWVFKGLGWIDGWIDS